MEKTFRVSRPLSLRLTLEPLQHGRHDPCVQWIGNSFWRATRLPSGPVTLRLMHVGDEVHARAWGEGADEALQALEELVGEHQLDGQFETDNAVVAELHRSLPGLRICRSRAVYEAALPAIIEQRVTSMEAKSSYRRIVRWLSEPAPGPFTEHGLYLPPDPKRVAATPYWAFHRFGVERKRANTLRRLGMHAQALDRTASLPFMEAEARMRSIPGIGPWTAAEVALTALGDPDAVIVGDYHLHDWVCWTLANEPRGDDDRMLELLEPFRGQRGRVIRLIAAGTAAGLTTSPPKYGPRYNPIPIASL